MKGPPQLSRWDIASVRPRQTACFHPDVCKLLPQAGLHLRSFLLTGKVDACYLLFVWSLFHGQGAHCVRRCTNTKQAMVPALRSSPLPKPLPIVPSEMTRAGIQKQCSQQPTDQAESITGQEGSNFPLGRQNGLVVQAQD